MHQEMEVEGEVVDALRVLSARRGVVIEVI